MNAQQLRNSILQEALQGRLVKQDSSEESASLLIQHIREEKKRLVKEGKLKKNSLEDNPIKEDEIPFEIPSSWKWCVIGDLFAHNNGKQLNKGNAHGKMMDYITTSNLQWEGFVLNVIKQMPFEENEVERCQAIKGDLLVCEGGDVGRAAIWNYDYPIMLQNHLHKLRAFVPLCTKYFYYLFYYYNKTGMIGGKGIGIQGFSSKALHNTLVPLPPLEEQYRIVKKVEELMPLVEKYGKAQIQHDQLQAELPVKLRQSVLQQAIQGLLVPQDAKEESADELLKRIRYTKERLVKEGKLKKKDLDFKPIEETELPFEIPENWVYVRLGELVYNQTGLSYSKSDLEKKVNNPIRVLRGGNIQNGSWCIKDDDVMIAPEFIKKQNLSLKKNTFITPAVTSLEHLGKTALIEEDHPDIVAGGFVLYLIPYYSEEETYIKYLSYFFQTSFYNKFCKSITNKSGQAFWNLSRQKLMDLTVPLPPLPEQKRIVAKIEETFNKIKAIRLN